MRLRGRMRSRWTNPRLLILRHYLQKQYCLLWPWPSSISSVFPSVTPISSSSPLPPRSTSSVTASQPPLTQAMILWMGKLAYFVDRRASNLEATIPRMIERDLTILVTPFSVFNNALATRVAVFDQGQEATDELTALKAATTKLRKDVD
ncbi:hypothetical protein EJD97_014547 [Solanum chilense]|uniref:Uncharacterized protein n=1 Tax=Solanum chilense TaxID=4083 RepID=A0A6N2B8W4_SOLCI|nr:hypothetical protein EJD97_014547 [Solanum chilense]